MVKGYRMGMKFMYRELWLIVEDVIEGIGDREGVLHGGRFGY